MNADECFSEEELEEIEGELEARVAAEFMFEPLTDALHYRMVMWITEVLEEEYGVFLPFELKFVEPTLEPMIIILHKRLMPA